MKLPWVSSFQNRPRHKKKYIIFQTFRVDQSICRLIQKIVFILFFSLIPASTIWPRLHETVAKSIRDDLVSVIVLFIIDVYMRPG